MRKLLFVLTMTLCLAGCGSGGETAAKSDIFRQAYRDMTGCTAEAEVVCGGGEDVTAFTLRCDYVPGGGSVVEVLSPETLSGLKAEVDETGLTLAYGDLVLPIGTLSAEEVSPAACIPALLDALRDGWLLEENKEDLEGIPCLRLSLDRTGPNGGKLVSTLWLREEDGTPVLGELAVDGEVILQARFTDFEIRDTIEEPPSSQAAGY